MAYDADVEFNAYDALLAFIANELVVDTKAYEADVAALLNEALVAFTTLLVVRLNVLPSPLVNVVVALLIDAVVNNEPVLTVAPAFKAKLAVTAYDELTACEAEIALSALEAVISKLPVIVFPKPVCNSLPLT